MDVATTEYVRQQITKEFERFENKRIPEGFSALPDIPTGRYIDDDFFALEQEHIWSKCWLLAALADELPDIGSYLLWERSGVPILIVRDRETRIRAFYNTCTHRGGPLVRSACGKEKLFVCKYHCWAFGLDGQLNHIPDEHEFAGIDKSQRGLKEVRCEQLGNLVFINRNPDADPLVTYLGKLAEELKDFHPEELKLVSRYTFDVEANWKIDMDAFLEVYHLKHIHPNTVDKALDHRGTSIALFPSGHTRMAVALKEGQGKYIPLPASDSLAEGPQHEIVRSTSLAFSMFPNVVTPIDAVSFPFLIYWPVSRTKSILEVIFVTRGENTNAESEEWKQKIAGFNIILGEDCENLPWIQRSIDSGAIDGIPLNYQERRIYHFHEYIDKTIGKDRIPEELHVAPRVTCLEEDGRGHTIG